MQIETSAKVSIAILPESKCGVGALACAQIQYGQPRAAILHETFAEVSNCY